MFKKLFKTTSNLLLLTILGVSLFGGMMYSLHLSQKQAEAAFYPVQASTKRLHTGISTVSTSVRLRSFNDLGGNKLTMSMFGSIGYVTFDPGISGKEESASFTGITDNGDGTQTLTGLTRGLLGRLPFGAGGTSYTHDANSYAVLSNSADFYRKFAVLENAQTWSAVQTFGSTSLPIVGIDTTSAQLSAATNTLVTYGLLADTSFAGTVNGSETVKGIVELATALESASSTVLGATGAGLVMQSRYATDTPTTGCATGYTGTAGAGCSVVATLAGKIKQTFLDIFTTENAWTGPNTFSATTTFSAPTFGANVYVQYLSSTTINGATAPVAVFVATSTNALWPTNASNATTSDFLGFAIENRVNGGTTTVQIDGVVNGLSGLTAGQAYYASTTGVLSSVYNNGTAEIYVGRAVSATQLLLDRKGDNWQYLGSATCSSSGAASLSCDIINPSVFSRFAIVVMNWNYSSGCTGPTHGYYTSTVTIGKVGATSLSTSGAMGASTASPAACHIANTGAAWTSTSSVRYTGSSYGSPTAMNATAYFYR